MAYLRTVRRTRRLGDNPPWYCSPWASLITVGAASLACTNWALTAKDNTTGMTPVENAVNNAYQNVANGRQGAGQIADAADQCAQDQVAASNGAVDYGAAYTACLSDQTKLYNQQQKDQPKNWAPLILIAAAVGIAVLEMR
jgi:hypothetical protein